MCTLTKKDRRVQKKRRDGVDRRCWHDPRFCEPERRRQEERRSGLDRRKVELWMPEM